MGRLGDQWNDIVDNAIKEKGNYGMSGKQVSIKKGIWKYDVHQGWKFILLKNRLRKRDS